jgi:DNA polymerase-3 subunit beta
VKFTVNAKTLAEKLAIVEPVAPKQSTVPILNFALIEATATQVTITTTDMDAYATAKLPVVDATPGTVCVPVSTLRALVAKLDDQPVTFKETERGVSVKAGKSNFRLNTVNADLFPVPLSVTGTVVSLDGAELSRRLKMVQPFSSKDGTRWYLNATRVALDADGNLSFVTTDGARLAMTTLDNVVFEGDPFTVLVSRQHVPLVLKFLEGEVSLVVSERSIRIETESAVFVAQQVEGQFPEFEKVIPQHERYTVFRADEMAKALDLVSAVMQANSAVVVSNDASEIDLKGSSEGKGDGDVKVPVGETTANFKMGLNVNFLAEAIAACGFEEVTMYTGGSMSPIKLVETGGKGESLFVLMPLRVSL